MCPANIRRVVGAILASAALCWTGCSHCGPRVGPLISMPSQDKLYRRASAEFQEAIFYKPMEGSWVGLESELAPLIVQEVTHPDAENCPGKRIGTVLINSSAIIELDTSQPALYAATSTVELQGTAYQQVTYVWFLGSASAERNPGNPARHRAGGLKMSPAIQAQGIRVTLASDGFPMMWEVLDSENATTLLFVSDSLERAAVLAFGPPLPSRRFAVERSLDEAPDTVVVRVIEDGPMPMGPFVYLATRGQNPKGGTGQLPGPVGPLRYDISTLLCRCSPSQVYRFVDSVYYDLLPLADLAAFSLPWDDSFTTATSTDGTTDASIQGGGTGAPKRVHRSTPAERLRFPPTFGDPR